MKDTQQLPFVSISTDNANFWSVPETQSYKKAYATGKEFGLAFVGHCQTHTAPAGTLLGIIIDGMRKHERGTPMFGYQAGFFAEIEGVLSSRSCLSQHRSRAK